MLLLLLQPVMESVFFLGLETERKRDQYVPGSSCRASSAAASASSKFRITISRAPGTMALFEASSAWLTQASQAGGSQYFGSSYRNQGRILR